MDGTQGLMVLATGTRRQAGRRRSDRSPVKLSFGESDVIAIAIIAPPPPIDEWVFLVRTQRDGSKRKADHSLTIYIPQCRQDGYPSGQPITWQHPDFPSFPFSKLRVSPRWLHLISDLPNTLFSKFLESPRWLLLISAFPNTPLFSKFLRLLA